MWSPTMTSGACIARFWRIGWGWTPSLSSAGRLKSSRTSSRGEQGIGGWLDGPQALLVYEEGGVSCLRKQPQDEPMTIATTWGEELRSAWGLPTRRPWPWMRTVWCTWPTGAVRGSATFAGIARG